MEEETTVAVALHARVASEVASFLAMMDAADPDDAREQLEAILVTEHVPWYLQGVCRSAVDGVLLEHWGGLHMGDASQQHLSHAARYAVQLSAATVRWGGDAGTGGGTDNPFADAYQAHVAAHPRLLLEIEGAHASAIDELRAVHANEVAVLRQQQQARRQALGDAQGAQGMSLSMLALQDKRELSLVEEAWRKRLHETQEAQRRDYREWIMATPPQDHAESETERTPPPPAPTTTPTAPADPGPRLRWLRSGLRTALSPVRTSTRLVSGLVTATMQLGRGRGRAGDSSAPVGTPTALHAGASGDAYSEGFTVHLGTQRKVSYALRLTEGEAAAQLSTLANTAHDGAVQLASAENMHNLMSLYSERLSALVMLTTPGMALEETATGRALQEACAASTEFHFASLAEQLDEVRAVCESQGQTLRSGDVFSTRHSNLREWQVVLHLACDHASLRLASADVLATGNSPILRGLRNALSTAAHFDVHSVTLPLLLSDQVTMAEPAWVLRRAEIVLKAVKGVLTSGNENHSLRQVCFTVPAPADCGVTREQFRALLGDVFAL